MTERKNILIFVGLVFLFSVLVFAQGTNVSVRVKVVDSSGSAIQEADVLLTGSNGNNYDAGTTDAEGYSQYVEVPAGIAFYLTATKDGYEQQTFDPARAQGDANNQQEVIVILILTETTPTPSPSTDFLVDEVVQSSSCSGIGYDEAGTFLDGNGDTIYHCVKKGAFSEGGNFVKNSYLEISDTGSCSIGGIAETWFPVELGTANLCVVKGAASSSSEAVADSFIGESCPAGFSATGSSIEASGRQIFHCITKEGYFGDSCTDIDGYDATTPSYAFASGVNVQDSCFSDTSRINEAVCLSGFPSSVVLSCSTGTTCSEGACVVLSEEPTDNEGDEGEQCSDSDRASSTRWGLADLYEAGSVTKGSTELEDTCLDSGKIKEYFCYSPGGGIGSVEQSCGSGSECLTDSDGIGYCSGEPPVSSPPSSGEDEDTTPPSTTEEECIINEAYWVDKEGNRLEDEDEVQEGERLRAVAKGSDSCLGVEAKIEIWEDEPFTDDKNDVSNLIFYDRGDGATILVTWPAEWVDDGPGAGDPEYFFVASTSDSVIRSPKVNVLKGGSSDSDIVGRESTRGCEIYNVKGSSVLSSGGTGDAFCDSQGYGRCTYIYGDPIPRALTTACIFDLSDSASDDDFDIRCCPSKKSSGCGLPGQTGGIFSWLPGTTDAICNSVNKKSDEDGTNGGGNGFFGDILDIGSSFLGDIGNFLPF
ncbi:carboxypeptidase regulatory-like domain-containing protein [Candidatus Pacearchaeota archaeon]|nr:carboxypeptidase regulatory-like domain-containing protein [Candidatus Pacearchaeota archaeon]